MPRKPDVDLQLVQRIAEEALPGRSQFFIERTADGVSTPVYRLRRDGATFYLRLAEEREASLAPEVLVHHLLRARGVRVPEVVHFAPFDEALQRAVMITIEIPGSPLSQCHADVDRRAVLVEAGRDLAVINSLAVAGFGWIRRDRPDVGRLAAELPTHRAFALDHLDTYLGQLLGVFLDHDDVRTISRTVARYDRFLDVAQARLAHGDLDVTHIYHQAGRYTGIIDFGEIRGAAPFYDLGHFALHDGEMMPALGLPFLLAGYKDATPLPPDYEPRIHLMSVLIGVRALARSLNKPRAASQVHLAASIRRSLGVLTA